MKSLYIFTFAVSLVGLILFCIPAARSNLRFVDRLALYPDKWELKLHDPEQKVFRQDEQSGKAKLLTFLQRYRHSSAADMGWLAVGLAVALAFSVVGWIRENELEKPRAEPPAPPNGGPVTPPPTPKVTGGPPSAS